MVRIKASCVGPISLSAVILISVFSFGTHCAGQELSQEGLYYIGDSGSHIFCLDEKLNLRWNQKGETPTKFYGLIDGYLVWVDGNKYKILDIRSGKTINTRELESAGRGFWTDGKIAKVSQVVANERKSEEFPVFPQGFKGLYPEKQVPIDKYMKMVPIEEKGELRIFKVNSFLFVASRGNVVWKMAFDPESIVGINQEDVLLARGKNMKVVDFKTGAEKSTREFPASITRIGEGSDAGQVFLEDGSKYSQAGEKLE